MSYTYISKCIEVVDEIANNFTFDARNTLKSLAVINSVLAVPTAAANALVIVAILTTSSLRTPSYLLLTSLAFNDFVVGLFGQPILATMIFSFFNENSVVLCYSAIIYYLVSSWTSWASLLVTAISLDRYLAIRLKMRYKTYVTISRIRRILVLITGLSFFVLVSPFIFKTDIPTFGIFGATFQGACLVVILVCYTMSFRALKIHCAQIQPQGNQQPNSTTQTNAIDVIKYRKLLKTMILIVIVIFICYLPMIGIFLIITVPGSYKSKAFRDFMVSSGLPTLAGLITIMTLNSTLNPIIYMTRMRDVRGACAQVLNKALRK